MKKVRKKTNEDPEFYANITIVCTWLFLVGTIIFQLINQQHISETLLMIGFSILTIGGISYFISK